MLHEGRIIAMAESAEFQRIQDPIVQEFISGGQVKKAAIPRS